MLFRERVQNGKEDTIFDGLLIILVAITGVSLGHTYTGMCGCATLPGLNKILFSQWEVRVDTLVETSYAVTNLSPLC